MSLQNYKVSKSEISFNSWLIFTAIKKSSFFWQFDHLHVDFWSLRCSARLVHFEITWNKLIAGYTLKTQSGALWHGARRYPDAYCTGNPKHVSPDSQCSGNPETAKVRIHSAQEIKRPLKSGFTVHRKAGAC